MEQRDAAQMLQNGDISQQQRCQKLKADNLANEQRPSTMCWRSILILTEVHFSSSQYQCVIFPFLAADLRYDAPERATRLWIMNHHFELSYSAAIRSSPLPSSCPRGYCIRLSRMQIRFTSISIWSHSEEPNSLCYPTIDGPRMIPYLLASRFLSKLDGLQGNSSMLQF